MRHFSLSYLSPLIAAVFSIIGIAPADGALTLTINTASKTFTWSGSATSDPILLTVGSFRDFEIGFGAWQGGDNLNGAGSFDVEYDVSDYRVTFTESVPGRITAAPSVNALAVSIGNFSNESDRASSVSLTVEADNVAYTYADASTEVIDYLESLNGTNLYFKDSNGGDIRFSNLAGQIVVIPEPSIVALGALGAIGLLRRRR
jgi:hypothetical protein